MQIDFYFIVFVLCKFSSDIIKILKAEWECILGSILSGGEETWCNKDIVQQKDAENTKDRAFK